MASGGGCGNASTEWDLADALGLPTPRSFPRKDQDTTLAPARLLQFPRAPFCEAPSNPTPHQAAAALLLSAWEGQANTIWYSTYNTAKAHESSEQTHFARATLGLPLRESGRWPHHGSLSCLEGQASGTGQVILRENVLRGCPTPPGPTACRCLNQSLLEGWLEGVTFRTNPGRRTGDAQARAGQSQGLPRPLSPLDIFSRHCCSVLKQAVCHRLHTQERTALPTPAPASFHMTWLRHLPAAQGEWLLVPFQTLTTSLSSRVAPGWGYLPLSNSGYKLLTGQLVGAQEPAALTRTQDG